MKRVVKLVNLSIVLLICLSFAGVTNAQSAKVDTVTKTNVIQNKTVKNKVNINMANAQQLATLPGIGKSKAQAIIDYRTAQGKFGSIDDLGQVKGIGAKLQAKLADKIVF